MASTQPGRQAWSSIRDSVGGVLWRLPTRQQSVGRLDPRNLVLRSPPWLINARLSLPRPFHSTTQMSPRHVRRSCTSGGLLLLSLSNPPTSTPTVISACAAAAESSILSSAPQNLSTTRLVTTRRYGLHTSSRGQGRVLGLGLRSYSSRADKEGEGIATSKDKPSGSDSPHRFGESGRAEKPGEVDSIERMSTKDPNIPPGSESESIANSMSKYIQTHLPKMPHRPTREELLAAANGFWERLKVRFKWFSIRSMRPWNADEWGAFVSWFLFGHLVWILVGTTTFFSLIIFTVNTVFAQGRKSPPRRQPRFLN